MGLPKEFHEQCECSLELHFLKVVDLLSKTYRSFGRHSYMKIVQPCQSLEPCVLLSFWHATIAFCKDFYCWAQSAVFNTADKILNSNVTIPEERACSAALRLMFQILSWNFKHVVEHESSDAKINSGLRIDTINLKKFERSLVKVYPKSYFHVCSVSAYKCLYFLL